MMQCGLQWPPEVGDDVYGDDKTTADLEARVADMLGKAAGLFVSSGTQSNLIAILCHAARVRNFCRVNPITRSITKQVVQQLLVVSFLVHYQSIQRVVFPRYR